jgi:hypothetical protein
MRTGKGGDDTMIIENTDNHELNLVSAGKIKVISGTTALALIMGTGTLFATGLEGIPTGVPHVRLNNQELAELEWAMGWTRISADGRTEQPVTK